jgi:hypothetical protein
MVASTVIHQKEYDVLLTPQDEALIARLTRAAYDVALRHAPNRPFTELELSLWRELRAVYQTEESGG